MAQQGTITFEGKSGQKHNFAIWPFNSNWELPSDRYLVKVFVTTSGEKATEVFRLINNAARTGFRLEPKIPDVKISDWRLGRHEAES